MTRNHLISLGQRVSSKFRRAPSFSFILGAIDTDAATTSQNQESAHSQQDEDTSEGEEKMDQEEKDYWQDVQMEVDGWRERVRQDDTLQEPAQEVVQEVGGRSRSRDGTRGATKKRGSRSGPMNGTRSKKGSARGV